MTPTWVAAPPPNERLEVEGLPLAEAVQKVLYRLENVVAAGLVVRDGDVNDPARTYHLTEAGVAELAAGTLTTPPVEEAQPEAQAG